jgi:hypothetical protein
LARRRVLICLVPPIIVDLVENMIHLLLLRALGLHDRDHSRSSAPRFSVVSENRSRAANMSFTHIVCTLRGMARRRRGRWRRKRWTGPL